MLDGIDYYPKKKKRSFRKLIAVMLFSLLLIGVCYYFQSLDSIQTKSSTIIISQPSEYVENENKFVEEVDESTTTVVLESNEESLDEVISNYEANTQN